MSKRITNMHPNLFCKFCKRKAIFQSKIFKNVVSIRGMVIDTNMDMQSAQSTISWKLHCNQKGLDKAYHELTYTVEVTGYF